MQTARFNSAINRPFFISRGDGAYVYDLDGREYIDMCMSHGASLLGHNHPKIREAMMQALDMGIICAYENGISCRTCQNDYPRSSPVVRCQDFRDQVPRRSCTRFVLHAQQLDDKKSSKLKDIFMAMRMR